MALDKNQSAFSAHRPDHRGTAVSRLPEPSTGDPVWWSLWHAVINALDGLAMLVVFHFDPRSSRLISSHPRAPTKMKEICRGWVSQAVGRGDLAPTCVKIKRKQQKMVV